MERIITRVPVQHTQALKLTKVAGYARVSSDKDASINGCMVLTSQMKMYFANPAKRRHHWYSPAFPNNPYSLHRLTG